MAFKDIFSFFGQNSSNDYIRPRMADGITPPRIIDTKTNSKNRQFEINRPLYLVYKAYRTDSILRQQVQIYLELALQNGFKFKTQNKKLEEQFNKRIKEIEINSNTTIYELIRYGLQDMIALGNSFFVFKRDKRYQSGKSYKYNDKTLEPIQGIYTVPQLTMQIQRRTSGEIVKYKQNPQLINRDYDFFTQDQNVVVPSYIGNPNYVRVFNREDVQHFKYDEDLLTGFGRPFYFETIDDLLMLREIESIVEEIIATGKLMYVYYKVGNDQRPITSQSEINDAKATLEENEPYGVLVIPDNHSLDLKSSNILQEILMFYDRIRMRVYGQLGLSTVQFGEAGSANRQTAETVADQMITKVRDFQKLFQAQFQHEVIEHILLDLGCNPKELGDEIPQLVFSEPDIDLAIKKQNAIVYLYEHSAVTQKEMREMLDMPHVEDQEDMYIYRVKIPQIKAGKEIDLGEADTENRVQPQNQHTQ